MPKSVIQTNKLLLQVALSSELSLVVLVVVIPLEGLVVVVEEGQLRERQLNGPRPRKGLNGVVQREAGEAVLVQPKAPAAVALEGAGAVLARVITAAIQRQTLIHIITAAAISVEPITSGAIALVTPGIVSAVLFTAGRPLPTLVYIQACFEVLVEPVALVAGADWSAVRMLTAMGAASIVVFTAVHNLHLNPVALFPISSQFVGCVAHTDKRAQSVVAAVSTVRLVSLTLINILTCLAVLRQHVPCFTVTENIPSIHSTFVTASSILKRAWIQQFAVLAVLCQLVVRFAPTTEMCSRLLDTVVLTTTVTEGTGENGQTGASVHM